MLISVVLRGIMCVAKWAVKNLYFATALVIIVTHSTDGMVIVVECLEKSRVGEKNVELWDHNYVIRLIIMLCIYIKYIKRYYESCFLFVIYYRILYLFCDKNMFGFDIIVKSITVHT